MTIGSARVLGSDVNGRFATLQAAIAWAIDEQYDIVNLSLAVRSRQFALDLAELADRATHGGTVLVCSAHNLPVESYPWRFASVVSVPEPTATTRGSHANPEPPVEFYARGVNVPIAWPGGGTVRATGTASRHRTSPGSWRSSGRSTRA